MQIVACREVRSASRRASTYWSRVAAAGGGGAVLLILMLQAAVGIISGRMLFATCIWIAFLLCLLEGVRQASTSIVEERVEGTLGLLLLTRVRGAELLLGKFAALMFFALQTLIAVGPVVGMSLVLGGVSGWEVVRGALALANTLVVALTIGLMISARSREPARAMIATFLTLGGGAILLMLSFWPATGWPGFIFNIANPFTPFLKFDDPSYATFRTEFWLSLLFTISIASVALWWTSVRLAALFAEERLRPSQLRQAEVAAAENQPESSLSFGEFAEVRARQSKRWFDGNPIEWLCLRNLNLHGRAGIPMGMAISTALLMAATHFYGFLISAVAYLVFGFLYSAGAAMTFARARQSGELELWLTTPLTVNEIMNGQLQALRKVFLWPGIVLLLGWVWMFYSLVIVPVIGAGSSNVSITVSGPGGSYWPFFYLLASTVLAMASLLFALPYVGMWSALKAKTPAQATMRTFLLMCIAPWIIIGIPKVIIFVPVALVASHSVRKLLKDYGTRGMAAQKGTR